MNSIFAGRSNGFNTEQQFQAACVKWFDNNFPQDRRMLHCNMNNSWNRIEGNKAQAMGVIKGVSDLELIGWGRIIFIELKQPAEKQSDEQRDFQRKVENRGHKYVVIEYLEDFQSIVIQNLTKRI